MQLQKLQVLGAAEKAEEIEARLVVGTASLFPPIGFAFGVAGAANNSLPTGSRVASGVGAVLSDAPLVGPLRGLKGAGAADDVGEAFFRGTNRLRGSGEVFPGSPGVQRAGVTPTSTDPVVATAFATDGENFGAGTLFVASGDDVAGVTRLPGKVRAATESEVVFDILPTEFAERAGTEVSAAQARAALGELGVKVPSRFPNVQAATQFVDLSKPLTPEQVQAFLKIIRSSR